jgi:hypothetical protein
VRDCTNLHHNSINESNRCWRRCLPDIAPYGEMRWAQHVAIANPQRRSACYPLSKLGKTCRFALPHGSILRPAGTHPTHRDYPTHAGRRYSSAPSSRGDAGASRVRRPPYRNRRQANRAIQSGFAGDCVESHSGRDHAGPQHGSEGGASHHAKRAQEGL